MHFAYWVDMAVPIFMVITGYVYYLSYTRRAVKDFFDPYSAPFLAPKLLRYTSPYAIALLVELFCEIFQGSLSKSFFFKILCGGRGPGSYYYPIMIQTLFSYPVIYFAIKTRGARGFLLCFFMNGMYELLGRAYGLNEECYRLLSFRYISLIAFGSLLGKFATEGAPKIPRLKLFTLALLSSVCGAIFITLVERKIYRPRIILYWTNTSFLATLYILPIFAFALARLKDKSFPPLERLGKASFNIYLTQMVYFCYADEKVAKLLPKLSSATADKVAQNIANILICATVGLIFFAVESRATTALLSATKKAFAKKRHE